MNNGPLVFLGIFFTFAFSWVGVILTSQIQYGHLAPYYDENEAAAFPAQTPGVAEQGKLVYQDLGCVSCHTQEVRRAGFSADIARGWGHRLSVARDYLREDPVLLGSSRLGPDLLNVGERRTAAAPLYLHLYDPQLAEPRSNMPAYPFLFTVRKIGAQPAPDALALSSSFRAQRHIPAGDEVVPSPRARALVAYLMSLKTTYDGYPEVQFVNTGKNQQEGEK